MDLDQIEREVEKELEEAIRAAERAPMLRRRLEVIRELKADYGKGSSPNGSQEGYPEPSEALTRGEWRPLRRTQAILRVLREGDGPLGPAQIAAILRERGREGDDPNYISAALAALQKQGRVRNEGFGKWVAVSRPPIPERRPRTLPAGIEGR